MARKHQKQQSPTSAPAEQQSSTAAGPGVSNADRQAQLEAATGFKGDLNSFKRRMETAFGGSLSGLSFVGGPEGQAGTNSSAVATIRGDTVFFGAEFAELSEDEQEHIAAHEIAHWYQASLMGGGAPGGGDAPDIEDDANRAAAAARSGGDAAPLASASPGGGHNFSWRDVTPDFMEDEIEQGAEAAMQLAMEKIASAQALLAFIGRFGQDAAKKAIDFLAEHKTEILVGFLTLSPTNALVVYVVKKLDKETIKSWLESAPVQTAATVVGAVLVAGAVAFVAPAIIMMGPLAAPILRELSGPAFALLWQHAPDDFKDMATDFVVDKWPVGLGLDVSGHLGATFGYPIYLGIEAFQWMSHFEDGLFKLQRGGFLTEAFDTGVGAGGFIGIGKDPKKKGGGEDGMGIGGEVGAEFMAGLKQYVKQDFEFPVREDEAFGSFLMAVMQADISGSMALAGLISPEIKEMDPLGYNTMTKFEFKVFAEGNAAGQGGVRTPGEGTQEGGGTWNQADGTRDNGEPKGIWAWLEASVAGRAAVEAGVGMEIRNTKFEKDADNVRRPTKMEFDLYGEGQAAASIVHKIPVISSALPDVPEFDAGVGIKVTWKLDNPLGSDTPVEVGEPMWKLYGKSGDLDRYSGQASETSIGIGNLTEETFASWDAFLDNIQGETEVKRRFAVGGPVGARFWRLADRQGAFTSMVPSDYRKYGFKVGGYLDLEAKLTADDVRDIFTEIGNASDRYLDGGDGIQKLYTDVLALLSTGKAPADVMAHLETIADIILLCVDKVHFHGLVGLTVAAGGKLGGGAKVRLDGSVGAEITIDKDLLDYVGDDLDLQDVKDILKGTSAALSEALEIEGTD